jgi:uncharacterized protein YcaQ
LWPGRRWEGIEGVVDAVRYTGGIQVDPLDVVGHSQDIALLGRVERYRPPMLDACLYGDRRVFEWGGTVVIRPVEELPYLRRLMALKVEEPRWKHFARSNHKVVEEVRQTIEKEGPKTSRDFAGGKSVQSYRARNAMGLALYYLWLKGELMIRKRTGGEKVYDLTERLLPSKLPSLETEEDTIEHLASEGLKRFGLSSLTEVGQILRGAFGRGVYGQERASWLAASERQGVAVRVRVEGWPGAYWLASETEEELDEVSKGAVPNDWKPVEDDEEDEAILLAPLERATAGGRAMRLFGFEYVWEVYKPASKRRWGYYVLPILLEDSLKGRVDLQRDADSKSLVVIGFWLENQKDEQNARFARAFGRSLIRLARMNNLDRVIVKAPVPRNFRQNVLKMVA